jgi:hypothetical protein
MAPNRRSTPLRCALLILAVAAVARAQTYWPEDANGANRCPMKALVPLVQPVSAAGWPAG